tara:strand:+ start:297 stop:659 length:363 start_codon:yes stop_codon:yes gene_type:complete
MGKRRKRMKMKKYAKKYATKRAALGFNKSKVENKVIVIDMTSGDDVTEEETVQVVSNTTKETKEIQKPALQPEPQLQVIQVEEPNAEEVVDVETPKPTRKRTPRKKTATPRKKTTKKPEE